MEERDYTTHPSLPARSYCGYPPRLEKTAMDPNRRTFLSLSALVPLLTALPFLTAGLAHAQSQGPFPRPIPFPLPGPGNPVSPSSPEPLPPLANPANAKLWLDQNQREMKRDIQKLCALADQLKQQVDKTDSTSVLSLDLVEQAKKIEDLAKHIKNLARGS
jgi:hypothetical protein